MKGNENYKCGIGNEKKVARKLKRMGAIKIEISPGSRGAADITASFATGRKLAVQVKSSCMPDGKAKKLTSSESKRLKEHSKKTNSTPVVAKVEKGRIKLSYLNTGRKVI